MNIDWNAFTPGPALLGGALIGLAAAWLILSTGRVAGISGILGALLRLPKGDTDWRLAFILGLLATPLLWSLLQRWSGVGELPTSVIQAGWPTLLIAGFVVGIGTRYGAGCTSGHGVCGLARLSPRSLVATLAFMASGFLTVYVIRHLLAG